MIKILRLRSDSDADIPLPRYMTPRAAGMDIYAANEKDVLIEKGAVALIPTGFAVAIPDGFEIQIRPRSGLAINHGIGLINSPGTIDADYRGEVCIIMINLGNTPFVIKRGDRIAQMVINRVYAANLTLSEVLPPTERDGGGFGHTGR